MRKSLLGSSIIAVLCLLLLGGCSALRIGYNQAPTLIYWWLDGYADFNDLQTPKVRNGLDAWFAWHRRTQLPDYATLLARAQTEALADTTAARTCEWWSELERRIDVAAEHALPVAAEIALTMTPAQIQHLERRYAKFNDEFRDEYLQPDPAKRLAKSVERAIERTESLYGRLDETQRARLARSVAESPFDADLWFSERQRRQQEALQILRKLTNEPGTTREQAQAALQAYLDHTQSSPRENYRRYAERLLRFNCGFSAAVHNTTNSAQRQAAAQRLKGWEADLRALAADPAS